MPASSPSACFAYPAAVGAVARHLISAGLASGFGQSHALGLVAWLSVAVSPGVNGAIGCPLLFQGKKRASGL